jgi:hypothetical protein
VFHWGEAISTNPISISKANYIYWACDIMEERNCEINVVLADCSTGIVANASPYQFQVFDTPKRSLITAQCNLKTADWQDVISQAAYIERHGK